MKQAVYVDADQINFTAPHVAEAFSLDIPPGFFDLPFKLGDRALIESDPTKLQIIPYLILTNEADEVFCYSRGGAGEEARLHGRLSIGLGGHVDTLAGDGENYVEHFRSEVIRELQEEVGVTPTAPIEFSMMLHDQSDEVGLVHLGLVTTYKISSSQMLTLEPGVIECGYFKHPVAFLADEFERMEPWSQVCLAVLRRDAFKTPNL
jgi:predicted NUDIX family phosphoesterase